jgi:hypothetical protein
MHVMFPPSAVLLHVPVILGICNLHNATALAERGKYVIPFFTHMHDHCSEQESQNFFGPRATDCMNHANIKRNILRILNGMKVRLSQQLHHDF